MRNLPHENEFCMQFHFHAKPSHFHKNGFAPRLALKQRHQGSEMAHSITITYRKIAGFVCASEINYLPRPSASANN